MSAPIINSENTSTENSSLSTAIENAATSLAAPAATETPAVPAAPESAAPETPAATPAAETATQTPSVDANTQRALDFYAALQNPETAPTVIEFLAKQSGFSLQKLAPPTQEPAAAAAPSISEMVTQALGEEYAFLGPKLGSALEQVIQGAIAPIQQQLLRAQVSNEFDRAVAELGTETSGDFKNFEGDVAKLMQKMRPGEGVSTKEYLSDLYTIAKARKGGAAPAANSTTAKAVVEKINKNASENLPSPSAVTENRIVKGPKLPTLDEAIAAAMQGQQFE